MRSLRVELEVAQQTLLLGSTDECGVQHIVAMHKSEPLS